METNMKSAALAFVLSAISTIAVAHPGPHEMEDAGSALQHFISSPDHFSWVILGGVLVATIVAAKTAMHLVRGEKSLDGRR
jgi:hypothetical protein